MDTLKDFISDIKERISNPFISSFIIAWIFRNYPIIITLIFYKQSDLNRDHYTSYIDVIQKNYSENHMLWFPLVVAITYTFVIPWVKSGIKIFNSWLASLTDTGIIRATKGQWMTVEKHADLSKGLEDEKARYIALITTAGTARKDYLEIKALLELEQNTVESEKKKLQELKTEHAEILNAHELELDERIAKITLENNLRVSKIQDSTLEENQNLRAELHNLQIIYAKKESEIALSERLKVDSTKQLEDFKIEIQGKDKRIDELRKELQRYILELSSVTDENKTYKEIVNQKESERERITNLYHNSYKSYGELLTKDYKALKLSSEIIDDLLEASKIQLLTGPAGKTNNAILDIRNRLSELQNEMSLTP